VTVKQVGILSVGKLNI